MRAEEFAFDPGGTAVAPQAVGTELIAERECSFVRRAIASWRGNPAIGLLGDLDAPRLPIVSLVARDGRPPGRLVLSSCPGRALHAGEW